MKFIASLLVLSAVVTSKPLPEATSRNSALTAAQQAKILNAALAALAVEAAINSLLNSKPVSAVSAARKCQIHFYCHLFATVFFFRRGAYSIPIYFLIL